MLRVNDAVGGDGVIIMDHSADPYAPMSVRASLGAIFTQRLVRADFPEFAWRAHAEGYTIIGTSPHSATDFRSVDYRSPLILLMGNERIGLTGEQQLVCDVMVTIPMLGHVDSLNVAIASSIILYEVLRQRERDEN
jgi:TrmH family RNA methyltransferase